jgi:hypothetical protein
MSMMPTEKPGYVYLIEARTGNERRYKIGVSHDPLSRKTHLDTMTSADEMKLLFHTATNYPLTLEARLHHRFKEKRTRGEWFKLSPEEVIRFEVFTDEEKIFLPQTSTAQESSPVESFPLRLVKEGMNNSGVHWRLVVADGKNDGDPYMLPKTAIEALARLLRSAEKKDGKP